MAGLLTISGAASALLVLALLAGAHAEYVTTAQCAARGRHYDIRQYPTDSDATELMLNSCGLTAIDSDTFIGLPKLDCIYLYRNAIETIKPAALLTAPSLRSIWLHENKLRELPVFEEHSCPNLTSLIVPQNQLTAINEGTFSACSKLQEIHLDRNQIEYIHHKVFNALTDLKVLYLNSNKISFIAEDMFVNNGKLRVLALENNRFSYLPADLASSLRSAGASLEYFRFYDNPFHCACLLELLADTQRTRVGNYKGWTGMTLHYDGTLPECNYISAYPCCRPARPGLLPATRTRGRC